MKTAWSSLPHNIPGDYLKIRIENSNLTKLHQRAFTTNGACALESLWLNFNKITVMNVKSLEGLHNLTELRMQGNELRSIPWTVFLYTPRLKILDLKHNRLEALPENSLHHLPALTYLDLSFNQLTVVSNDVFLSSPHSHTQAGGRRKEGGADVVLALHDNHWLCDCTLKGFVDFVTSINQPFILMNPYLTCSGPSAKAGKFFHELELKTCLKPEVATTQVNITLPLGANITLRCLVKARPDPMVEWNYSLKTIRQFTESQLQVSDDTINSALMIPSIHLADQGLYTCTASNVIGTSFVGIQLNVLSSNTSFSMFPAVTVASTRVNASISTRIAKQTVDGVTVAWNAVTENPAETWFAVHFGRYDSQEKELHYVGPGINSYSVTALLPATKYEVCVSLQNRPARQKQCVVFVTRSGLNEAEKRWRLIHIIVIVCVMVLAAATGMCICVTDFRAGYRDHRAGFGERSRTEDKGLKQSDRQGTFDSLQPAGDGGLCRDSGDDEETRSEHAIQTSVSVQL
ncbi:leucine-rich repeat, immunoglobulin-like domain and transmembrane domain-containing protein 2 [Brachyhypopomus gauderio]|uniref:leucine-rich repeat, immunoglobulin-like domain and transmembrane domain-containing protein 2 n=1 Tax=Brachyhypopomus gauderio TaxID=698409 RepID=UPI004040FF84